MFLGVGLNEILWLAAAIVFAGMITGVLAGLFGIGGGAVIVPVLYEVFRVLGVPEEVRMQLCVGTSLAIILPTTIRSYLTHRAKGLVIPRVIRLWALPAVIGVACGAVIAAFAPPAVFKLAFVLIASFHRDQILVCRRSLESRHRSARHGADDPLWLRHRPRRIADGRERRFAVEHRAHALWQADPQCRRDLVGPRRADHDRRHARLYPRRPARPVRCCRRCRSASCR